MERRLKLVRRLYRYRAALERQQRLSLWAARHRLHGVQQEIGRTVQALTGAADRWRADVDATQTMALHAYMAALREQLDGLLATEARCREQVARAAEVHAKWWRGARLAESLAQRLQRLVEAERARKEQNELDDLVLQLRLRTDRF